MFAVDPGLAKERAHPGAGAVGGAMQFVSGLLFLFTQVVAAVDAGRMHYSGGVPAGLRFAALAVFGLSGALQTWAMAVNPLFTRRALLKKLKHPVSLLGLKRQHPLEEGSAWSLCPPGFTRSGTLWRLS
jgi:hypothetical protein